MACDILYGNTLEIVDLTAREDCWEDLMLLCGGEDKDGIGRRLLKGLEEGVEGRDREHVYLINDVDLVLA